MPELQGPVRKSKQFGGRSETESHTRSERQIWMRVRLFHLPDGKEAPLIARGVAGTGDTPRDKGSLLSVRQMKKPYTHPNLSFGSCMAFCF